MMRLLEIKDDGSLQYGEHEDPPTTYAMFSHTWDNQKKEINLQQFRTCLASRDLTSCDKILSCAAQARRDGYRYFWLDSCCIDQTDPYELDDALRSMWSWYTQATRIYVLLADVSCRADDVPLRDFMQAFHNSRWFKRGWTLQELLALEAGCVMFFSAEGTYLGSKETLMNEINDVTGIPHRALWHPKHLSEFSLLERMSWMDKRETQTAIQKVYCMAGILSVTTTGEVHPREEMSWRRRDNGHADDHHAEIHRLSTFNVDALRYYNETGYRHDCCKCYSRQNSYEEQDVTCRKRWTTKSWRTNSNASDSSGSIAPQRRRSSWRQIFSRSKRSL